MLKSLRVARWMPSGDNWLPVLALAGAAWVFAANAAEPEAVAAPAALSTTSTQRLDAVNTVGTAPAPQAAPQAQNAARASR